VQTNIAIKSLLLSAILINLTACSESTDPETLSNQAGINPVTTETGDSTTNSGGSEGTNTTTTGGTTVTPPADGTQTTGAISALTNSVPQVIDPDSAANTEHFWSIDLQPGFYHVVLESSRIDDRSSNLGIELTDLRGFETADDVQIIQGNEIDFRARTYAFIEVEQARTVVLRAEPSFAAQEYSLAIFENGSAVPSPFFTNCPDIAPLSLGTTESLALPASSSIADDRWYQIELDAIDHLLLSSASRTDGRDSNIIYTFTYLDQFGQISRIETASQVNEIGVSANGSGSLNRSEPGNVWIRLRNNNAELTMEFTLNPES